MGWTKGLELAKLARQQGQRFESATWLHKARQMPKAEFQREVEKELTGKDSEPSELIYFKVYKSQIPVIEQAIETAALMLGSDKSRGYCLEMICADFLAGASIDGNNPEILLQSISRYYKFLPGPQQEAFLSEVSRTGLMKKIPAKTPRLRLDANELPRTASAGAGARRLAMPGLRQHAAPAGTPPQIPQPVGWRRGTEPDHTVRGVSRPVTFTATVKGPAMCEDGLAKSRANRLYLSPASMAPFKQYSHCIGVDRVPPGRMLQQIGHWHFRFHQDIVDLILVQRLK